MADQSTTTDPPNELAWPDGPQFEPAWLGRLEPAKVVVKADLLPALSVLLTIPLLGMVMAWLWAQLAPPQHVRVFPDGELVPLVQESYHRFDGLVLFTLLCLAAGLVTGV